MQNCPPRLRIVVVNNTLAIKPHVQEWLAHKDSPTVCCFFWHCLNKINEYILQKTIKKGRRLGTIERSKEKLK